MRNLLKACSIVCLALVIVSCSKDDDPVDNNLFIGTYDGSVNYKTDSTVISDNQSSVTVVKAGDNYNFIFNKDGIPPLKGVEFEDDGDHGIINVDFQEGVQVIRIDESSLYILYSKGNQTWTADCSR